MPGFLNNPSSIISQIKSNLQDRYGSGYPILKELLQNADDAEATRFRLDALPGWSNAVNPLLRGPGLLVANDGFFRKRDENGIMSFGESSKVDDNSAIGKFGFGQKAVFHLCDAFIVHARRENGETFSTVINPFLDVVADNNISSQWELPAGGLDPTDVGFMTDKIAKDFPTRRLVLWLPLRREEIQPAPGVGFSSNIPSPEETIRELLRPDELRVLLTALRHLKSIEIMEGGRIRCAFELNAMRGRFVGPRDLDVHVQSFGGEISATDRTTAPFVGREAKALDGRLAALKLTHHWPKSITALSPLPVPEKGEPHGAATLLRIPKTGIEQTASAHLRVSWAVFLPISDKFDVVIPVEGSAIGQFNLLLHGYFFLDSGRNRIEWPDANVKTAEPANAVALRCAWNGELRDSVVLPLLPLLLRDALGSKMVTSAELSQLVSALARHEWFQNNREAMCREHSLVRVLEASGGIVWRVVSCGDALRPLPASVADTPKRIGELFGDIGSWAETNNARLVVDTNAALSARPIRWTEADLSTVFTGLSPRAFQSRDFARLLVDFLGMAGLGDAERSAIGPHMVAALRKAIMETTAFAPTEFIKSALAHLPHGALFPLPPSVENRDVLRALATVPADVLPVRNEWLDDVQRPLQLSHENLKALLIALEPMIDGGSHSDQAATAALALLMRAERGISNLAADREFASVKVLRVRDVRSVGPVALSLEMLVARSKEGLLFAKSPQAESVLPLLAEALPDVSPLIVEGKTADFLKDSSNSDIRLQGVGNEAILELVRNSTRFGAKEVRRRLFDRLSFSENDDRIALRCLCAGDKRAGYAGTRLYVLKGMPQGLERIVESILTSSETDFLVPAEIDEDIKSKLREHIDIKALDTPRVAELLDVDKIAALQPTPDELVAFLLTELSDSLLRRLPIHARSDGKIGDVENVFREAGWTIPETLRPHVLTIKPCGNKKARERQEQLIKVWSPQRQVEVALDRDNPHRFRGEILDALAKLESPPDASLLEALRAKPWLLAGDQPVKPQNVFAVPPAIDEAARALLMKNGESPPFLPVAKLSIDVREHCGFDHLEKWVLPDRHSSFEALALMVNDAKIIGRIGPANFYPVDDLKTLASETDAIALPGWPLLAAILASPEVGHDDTMCVVNAFTDINASETGLAGTYLDRLATLARENGRRGEAARKAYRHGFNVVAGWPDDARCQAFVETQVPTEAGGWRSAREVVQRGDGLDPSYVLERGCASMLGKRGEASAEISGAADETDDLLARRRGEIKSVNLDDLEAKSLAQQRAFIGIWRGRVPSDLVIVYLGLIGRSKSFRRLANEWATDATDDVDTIWADLDSRFPNEILSPNSLAKEVDERRFLIDPVLGEHVRAVAMSGDLFNAPLGGSGNGILIGNLHKTHEGIRVGDGRVLSLITLPVREVDPTGFNPKVASDIFRRFVEKVAEDCLWLGMDRQRTALRGMLDKAIEVDQSTIEETERLLRDRLPTILAELKLPTEYRSQQALRKYQSNEGRLNRISASAQEKEELKAELWQRISDGASADELLSAVRSKIGDFGYSASRVLFELFQNADDAYRQHEGATNPCFRVEPLSDGSGGFRVVHWGRPINHMGRDTEEGRHLGHDRDLLNMLLMNFSEKRPGDDLTGKFGLGFKSVHVLTDNVGIASGFIALRTVGGFLPTPWPAGIDIGESRKQPSGRKATVIDVPFSTETAVKGAEAVNAFRAAVTWLPAFARTIRRVEIEGDVPVDCIITPLPAESDIQVVSISGQHRERALRLDLLFGFCLLLRIGAAGPCVFRDGMRRLWNLAPLEEELRSGWLLNGPFAVDPGRTGLAGSIADRQEKFQKLGRALGECLLKLHDLADADWHGFAERLDLDASKATAWSVFWTRLFDVFALDFDDDLAGYLHADGHGYGHLARHRQVVPTRLPAPFASLVRASDVEKFTAGALADPATLGKVQWWPAMMAMHDRMVASEIDAQLRKLGFVGASPLHLADLLDREMGQEKRIDVELSARLGQVFTPKEIGGGPLNQERWEILDLAGKAQFRAQEGSWRSVRELISEFAENDDEKLLCGFAPENALLHRTYQDAALEFFRAARSQSGYSPKISVLLEWTRNANGDDRRRAALRYIVEGSQGSDLAKAMRVDLPNWVPQPLERLLTDVLIAAWADEDKKRLLIELGGHQLLEIGGNNYPSELGNPPPPDPETVLSAIHAWWRTMSVELRESYKRKAYPEFFSPAQLRETADRTSWFTMFAMACFHTLGRTKDEQHRIFIETGFREGWWQDLAESRPPSDVQSWLERLERWSGPDQFDQQHLPWRRTFVDLYTVARWLDEYREIIVKLPRIIEDHGIISLNGALQPSYWAPAMRLCIDAAPMNRSLGIGMNWLIRELPRHGVYGPHDHGLMAPYGWASTQRVRDLLNGLGADVGSKADKEASRGIYDFVATHLGNAGSRFDGDFDLPLQLITKYENRASLGQCYESVCSDPPTFDEEDTEDEFESAGADA